MKMKNKQVVQATARKERKNALAAVKISRRSEPVLERAAPIIMEKPTILIVCEGKNTEPSYFLHFKLTSAKIKAIGKGYNTLSLVNQAIELQQKGNYDQVWCVFDKDNSSDVSFNKTIELAAYKDFGIAYSNQAFEYWLILHFEDHQGGGMSRREYDATINAYIKPMGAYYDGNGNKKISESFWEILNGQNDSTGLSRRDLAITRSKRNYDLFDHISPAKEESSTTVFRLVEEILKYI
jgi:hypothetical protein